MRGRELIQSAATLAGALSTGREHPSDRHRLLTSEQLNANVRAARRSPAIGTVCASAGLHAWSLRVEGNNDVMIGVVTHRVKFFGLNAWGFDCAGRSACAAGKSTHRGPGPNYFSVPFDVELRLDCAAGVLGAMISGVEFVVSDALPRGQPMSLAVGIGNSPDCKVTLTGYTRWTAEDVLVLTLHVGDAGPDRSVDVLCTNMGGDELVCVHASLDKPVHILWSLIRTALEDEHAVLSTMLHDGRMLSDGDASLAAALQLAMSTKDDLNTMTTKELKQLCKDRGLSQNGNKSNLLTRLAAAAASALEKEAGGANAEEDTARRADVAALLA